MKLKSYLILLIGIFTMISINPVFGQTTDKNSTAGNENVTQVDTLHRLLEMNAAINLKAVIYVLFLLALAYGLILSLTLFYKKQLIRVSAAKRIKVSIVLVTIVLIDLKIINLIISFDLTGQIISVAIILLIVCFGYGWIKDFFSWIYLSMKPVVCEGARVEIGAYRGLVVKMTILNTVLSTVDGKEVWIPNRQFIDTGFSIKKHNAIHIKFYVPADTDLNKIQELLTDASKVAPYIDLEYEAEISFSHIILDNRPWLQVELRVCADVMDNESSLKNDLEYRIQKELYNQKIVKFK